MAKPTFVEGHNLILPSLINLKNLLHSLFTHVKQSQPLELYLYSKIQPQEGQKRILGRKDERLRQLERSKQF
jgi:hypothetical protein